MHNSLKPFQQAELLQVMPKRLKRPPKRGNGGGKDSEEREVGAWWPEPLRELRVWLRYLGPGGQTLSCCQGSRLRPCGAGAHTHTHTHTCTSLQPSHQSLLPLQLGRAPLHQVSKANVDVQRPGVVKLEGCQGSAS